MLKWEWGSVLDNLLGHLLGDSLGLWPWIRWKFP